MKRIFLRVMVAALTFGFAVAVERAVISPLPASSQAVGVEPVIATRALSEVEHSPAATSFPLPVATPSPRLLFDYNPAKFDPRGTYYVLHPLPKEFAEVDLFELAVEEFNGAVSGSAYFQTRIDDVYESQNVDFLVITERRLLFVTVPSGDSNIAYRFEGEFPANPRLRLDSGKAGLRGTLTKTSNGRTIAQTEVTFEVKYLGC